MAGVVSKAAGIVVSPSRFDRKSAIVHHHPQQQLQQQQQRVVCAFPVRSNEFSPSLKKLRCVNRQATSSNAQTSLAPIGLRNAPKWWEKGLQPNMKEVSGAQDLVDSLLNAGDKLVVVDFFSPGCGGCKALHPKICQIAEMNPDVQFLQVNYEEYKSMCYSLNVHVLPFFRFYRGAEGRVCSFSCTNATIKKFRDALAKYGLERSSTGPAKGLEEKELIALASNKDLSFEYKPKQEPVEEDNIVTAPVGKSSTDNPNSEFQLPLPLPIPLPLPTSLKVNQVSEDKAVLSSSK